MTKMQRASGTEGGGPWNLAPEVEAARQRGVWRAVSIVLTILPATFLFVLVWALWRLGAL